MPNLNFKTAFEFAQAAEVAEQNNIHLQKLHAPVTPVHTVQKQQSRQDGLTTIAAGASTLLSFQGYGVPLLSQKGTSRQALLYQGKKGKSLS